MREGVLLAYPFDERRLALAGDPVPIAEGVGAVPNGPVTIASVSASGNGVLAYRRAERVHGMPVWVTGMDAKWERSPARRWTAPHPPGSRPMDSGSR